MKPLLRKTTFVVPCPTCYRHSRQFSDATRKQALHAARQRNGHTEQATVAFRLRGWLRKSA